MTKGVFITGTGTEVGKTIVAAGILRWLIAHDTDAVPFKPVQTGATLVKDKLLAPDLEYCLSVSGLKPNDHKKGLMAPYIYEPACSPHLAGRLAQHYPDLHLIENCIYRLLKDHDFVIAEGAGGIMVPLDESTMMLDLMKQLSWPVILVAHIGLGTINHTLLSIRVLRDAGLDILGVVFNEVLPDVPEDDFIRQDNPDTIARLGNVPVLGILQHMPELSSDVPESWRQFERDMPGLVTILERAKDIDE